MGFKIEYEDFVKTYSIKHQSSIYYLKVLQKFEDGWDIKKISNYFNISYFLIWRWVKKKSVPIPFVKYQKIKKEFDEKEINDLAPIIGHIFGDGGITNRGIIHYCNTEKFLIDEFISGISKVFNEPPRSIKEEIGITRVKYPTRIGKSLWCFFGKFSFGKDTKWIMPLIQDMPLEWRARMLRSWFNDDGSVPKYGVVAIKQKLEPLIFFIQNTLLELGIKSIMSRDEETRRHLRICGYRDLVRFKERVNFLKGYRKSQKLSEIITKKIPKLVTKEKILKLLNESPKTVKELSGFFDFKLNSLNGHLHGWKRKLGKKKSTKGLVELGLVKVRKKGRINVYFLSDTLDSLEKQLFAQF